MKNVKHHHREQRKHTSRKIVFMEKLLLLTKDGMGNALKTPAPQRERPGKGQTKKNRHSL
jgi:hypothetical protein